MKTSFCMMGFGYTREIAERCISLAGELGYDGIEFWKQYLDHADLDWTRDAAEEQGLQIVQVCPYFDFTTSSDAYEETLREADRFVEYARKLGAPFIRTYTGKTPSFDATDEMWDRCVEGLRVVCDAGAQHGVTFLLETHQVIHGGPCLTDTSTHTLRLMELVGRPNLRVALQTPLIGESTLIPAIWTLPSTPACYAGKASTAGSRSTIRTTTPGSRPPLTKSPICDDS